MNIRTKIILENLQIAKNHKEQLTDWEVDFILSLCERDNPASLTTKEFNKLHQIATAAQNAAARQDYTL